MDKSTMITLGVETSCDETSCAILKGSQSILSNIVASSLAKHKEFGGVVPEIACRQHLETIDTVFQRAIAQAKIRVQDIDLISVTQGPGLIGALLVGMSFAKTLAFALNKPLIGVNHLEAHLEAVFIENSRPEGPFLGLVVSGGHTQIVLYEPNKGYQLICETRDDACGEAFDKVAKILGLGYPGGPIIDRLSEKGNAQAIDFPCGQFEDSFDFSFSGTKTAVLYYVRKQKNIDEVHQANVAASFQRAVVSCLIERVLKVADEYGIDTIVVGGGVSANRLLRSQLSEEGAKKGINVLLPSLIYSQDNAAMIARCGYEKYNQNLKTNWKMTASPNLPFALACN